MNQPASPSNLRKRFNKWYGWVPDLPDQRDFIFQVPNAVQLPTSVDLRPKMPAVYDQGQLGSCTANAIAGAYEYEQLRNNLPAFMPSRLFVYYNERSIEGTVGEDAGAMIRDGIKSVANVGICPEKMWGYSDGATKFKRKPSTRCYTEAQKHQLLKYQRVLGVSGIQQSLAQGFPVVAGFTVYDSFEGDDVARTGNVPVPAKDEQVLGGHAILIVGYENGRWIVRNSWAADWGDKGYCYMPFAIVFSDCWNMQKTEN
jgi:C1A family cysteine protease